MQLFIEPSDVWLFRDGRPFSAGTDRRANSVFPPPPTVTAGMIRTAYLLAKGVDPAAFKAGPDATAKQDIGSPTEGEYGNLRLCGPFLAAADAADNVTRYYPAPADLYVKCSLADDCQQRSYHRPQVIPSAGTAANWPQDSLATNMLWLAERNDDEYKVENVKGWLSHTSMTAYLQGKVSDIKVTEGDELFEVEERLGIELGSNKATVEGKLYTVGFTRPIWRPEQRVGLSLEVEGGDWLGERGTLSLGGERRVGHYITSPSRPAISRAIGPKLRVYFATPAYFEGGWQPANWGRYFSGNPELVAAAVNQPLTMAGFDLAHNQHKPARRFIPAGSVYYLQSKSNEEMKVQEKDENGKPIYGISDFGAQIGFGQVLIGEW